MTERDNKLKGISREINEHVIAVKGTLELIEASVSESELQSLIRRAIERMDAIQELSQEVILALKNCLERIKEMQNQKSKSEQE
jgi:hypothetical protein